MAGINDIGSANRWSTRAEDVAIGLSSRRSGVPSPSPYNPMTHEHTYGLAVMADQNAHAALALTDTSSQIALRVKTAQEK